ncbi:hypothetical protein DXG01_016396 [Tephrocybe rancida]|nr:hypothetical protein DXG01_016396 [Tephrocybe rancida]
MARSKKIKVPVFIASSPISASSPAPPTPPVAPLSSVPPATQPPPIIIHAASSPTPATSIMSSIPPLHDDDLASDRPTKRASLSAVSSSSNSEPHPLATKSTEIRLARKGKENAPPRASPSTSAGPNFFGFSKSFAAALPGLPQTTPPSWTWTLLRSTSSSPWTLTLVQLAPLLDPILRAHLDIPNPDGADICAGDIEMGEVEVEDRDEHHCVLPADTSMEDELAALFNGLSVAPSLEELQAEASAFLDDLFTALAPKSTSTHTQAPNISAELKTVIEIDMEVAPPATATTTTKEVCAAYAERWAELAAKEASRNNTSRRNQVRRARLRSPKKGCARARAETRVRYIDRFGTYCSTLAEPNHGVLAIGSIRLRENDGDDMRPSKRLKITLPSRHRSRRVRRRCF